MGPPGPPQSGNWITGYVDIAGTAVTLVPYHGGPLQAANWPANYLVSVGIWLFIGNIWSQYAVTAVTADTATLATNLGSLQAAFAFPNPEGTLRCVGVQAAEVGFSPFAASLTLPSQLGEGPSTYFPAYWGGEGPWQFGDRLLALGQTIGEPESTDPATYGSPRTVLVGSDDDGLGWDQVPPVTSPESPTLGSTAWPFACATLDEEHGLLLIALWRYLNGVLPAVVDPGMGHFDNPILDLVTLEPFSGALTKIVYDNPDSPQLDFAGDAAFPVRTPQNGYYAVHFNDNGPFNNTGGNIGTWAVAKTSGADSNDWDMVNSAGVLPQAKTMKQIEQGLTQFDVSAVGIAADWDDLCYFYYFRSNEYVAFRTWDLKGAVSPETILSDWWPDKTKPQPLFVGKVFYVRQNGHEDFAVLYTYPDASGQAGTKTTLGLRVGITSVRSLDGAKHAFTSEDTIIGSDVTGTVNISGTELTLVDGGPFTSLTWPADYLLHTSITLIINGIAHQFTVVSISPDGRTVTVSLAPGDATGVAFYFPNPNALAWNSRGTYAADVTWSSSGRVLFCIWQRSVDNALMFSHKDYDGGQGWADPRYVMVPGAIIPETSPFYPNGTITAMTIRSVGVGIGIIFFVNDPNQNPPFGILQMQYYYLPTYLAEGSPGGPPSPPPAGGTFENIFY